MKIMRDIRVRDASLIGNENRDVDDEDDGDDDDEAPGEAGAVLAARGAAGDDGVGTTEVSAAGLGGEGDAAD